MKTGTDNLKKSKKSSAFLRGLAGWCPACGSGKLYSSYLKPAETCSACGEPLCELAAEDGPAWLTVLLLGPILIPSAFILTMKTPLPTWLSLIIMIAFAIVAVLLLLPRVKGALIAFLWILEQKQS